MIARRRVLADEQAQFREGPVPQIDGIERIRAAVRAAGGRADVLERALASGGAADSGATARAGDRGDPMRDLIAWAAWRAGVLGIRDDALGRLQRALAEGHGEVAAAALGLRADDITAFAAHQRTDRFWWPGRAAQRGYVLATGGFRGFGGTWIRPPERAFPLGDGAFGIRVADEWWRLDADVFGAVLRRAADQGALDRAETRYALDRAQVAHRATLVLSDGTHLAWIHVAESA